MQHIVSIEFGLSLEQAQIKFRESYIRAALAFSHGNQCNAAEMIGVHRNTLAREIERSGIDYKKYRRRGKVQPHGIVAP